MSLRLDFEKRWREFFKPSKMVTFDSASFEQKEISNIYKIIDEMKKVKNDPNT